MRFASFALTVGMVLSSQAFAAELEKLTPPDGLERTELRHLVTNDAGDYVAVSHSRVFMGNYRDATFVDALNAENTSFVLEGSASLNGGGANPGTISAYIQMLGTRLAMNANGDFILASNTLLFAGNARTHTIQQVAEAGRFTQFQQVAINDAGHFVGLTGKKIFAGTVGGTVTELLSEAVGSFDHYYMYAFNNSFDMETGYQRLALNGAGQFVAITGSAVYGGSVPAGTVEKIYEERWAGFTHVKLGEDGVFITVTDDDIYRGSL